MSKVDNTQNRIVSLEFLEQLFFGTTQAVVDIFSYSFLFCRPIYNLRGHPLSTYVKFPEKLTFLTFVSFSKMLVLWKILRTYLMDDP